MAGACANEEVAITVANRIVINDVKVFMVACCQRSVAGDKRETNQKNKTMRFISARRQNRDTRRVRTPEDSRG